MNELLAAIAAKRERLDQLRPLSAKMLANLEHRYDIELKDRLEYIRSLQEDRQREDRRTSMPFSINGRMRLWKST
ncbi:MAG: hypothetical protein JO182_28645 [Acidobacteriaceae bacterium]|nr:hypothetical protein [Acidobacteriaceae bacterium]MBV9038491.1 hypothetical protein [Acidobacteriaceae bacterium]